MVRLQLFFNFQLYLHFKSYLLYKLGEIRENSQELEINGFCGSVLWTEEQSFRADHRLQGIYNID